MKSSTLISAAALCFVAPMALTAPVAGQSRPNSPRWQEPIRHGDELIFPEGYDIPRAMTQTELDYIRDFPLGSNARAVTSPPAFTVRTVAEYEPTDGVCLSWRGTSSQNNILAQMARWITTSGNAKVYLMVSAASQASALSTIQGAGADMTKVIPRNITTDSIWIRDYGPRYVYQGQVRAIVDHTYNRPRPNDDVQPLAFSLYKRHAFYEHQLVHGGGNYHCNGMNQGYATQLIVNENPTLNGSQIVNIWNAYMGINTTITAAFPTSVDSTQHIDMWMQIIDHNKVIISDWPNNAGSTQDLICDNMANTMAAGGWNVYRTPARSVSGVHYTYTNVVMCNDIVLVPFYTNATVSPHNNPARDVFVAALPGKTIIQVNSDALVTSAGVMHCVMMHVPAHLGGVNPTVFLETYRGGQTLQAGQQIALKWLSDDDNAPSAGGVQNVDVMLSTDGGATFPITIASSVPDSWTYNWTVPANINTANGRFKIVARDQQGNTGFDASVGDIVIGTPPAPCPADVTSDSVVNVADLLAVIQSWGACSGCAADINDDNVVNVSDLLAVIQAWGSCP